MKRVLSLSTLYPNAAAPRFGTFVARSLEALAARGDWGVTLINPLGVPPLALGRYRALAAAATGGQEGGVDVHRPRFTLIPRLGARMNAGTISKTVLPLARRLHAEQPFDLVDAQFFYPDGPAAAAIARSLQLPLTIKARGSDISYWGDKGFAREQMLDAAAQARGLLAVSEALKLDMVQMGMDGGRIAVHYTGLDRDRFRPLGHVGLRAKLSRELGIALPEAEPLLATVGALTERKGQDLVLAILAGMPAGQLLLVGKGEDERHLRQIAGDMGIADRVHFLGSVDHDLLPVILSASDVMVLPSRSEGLANAWVEALACGTPVVTCAVGGAQELIRSRAAGMLVERTVDGVAAGVRAVLSDKADPQEVARSVAHLSWDENAAALAAFYDRITGQAASATKV